jgi:hypothetical protein
MLTIRLGAMSVQLRADVAAALGVSATRLSIVELSGDATRAVVLFLKPGKSTGSERDRDAETLVRDCILQAVDSKSVLRSVIPTLKSASVQEVPGSGGGSASLKGSPVKERSTSPSNKKGAGVSIGDDILSEVRPTSSTLNPQP